MKCSECGGNVTTLTYSVYCPNGDASGYHSCSGCGKRKGWSIKGPGEKTVDMS